MGKLVRGIDNSKQLFDLMTGFIGSFDLGDRSIAAEALSVFRVLFVFSGAQEGYAVWLDPK